MILDLVVEAVEIKLGFENFTGILQSNYECAYALGKMMHLLGMPSEEGIVCERLGQLRQQTVEKMETYEPRDEAETNLMKLLKEYRMQSQDGEELQLLYERGYESIKA